MNINDYVIPRTPLSVLIPALKDVLGVELDPNSPDVEIEAARCVEKVLSDETLTEAIMERIEIYEEGLSESR